MYRCKRSGCKTIIHASGLSYLSTLTLLYLQNGIVFFLPVTLKRLEGFFLWNGSTVCQSLCLLIVYRVQQVFSGSSLPWVLFTVIWRNYSLKLNNHSNIIMKNENVCDSIECKVRELLIQSLIHAATFLSTQYISLLYSTCPEILQIECFKKEI